MKLQLFGKEAEIRKEAVIAAVSVLALLGMLIGYIFFRDTGDIIIVPTRDINGDDAGGTGQAAGTVSSDATTANEVRGNKGGNGQDAGAADGAVSPEDGIGNASGSIKDKGSTENGISAAEEGKIMIYVVGCVNKPGIVTLDKGSMIFDAVREAGGLTEDADKDNINMVYSLNENAMLYIKSKTDESSGLGKAAAVVSDSGNGTEVIARGDDTAAGGAKSALVNINTAGIEELDTLPGIGEATARDIIAYREKSGGFETIEDIMKVPRIKQNRFDSIKDYIVAE